ncbi:recombinase family protein [uncultured Parasphingorhabdus sp.]|uniref:recombinase family protein n=1 Tax=uncultured Parasphingorhabdus sp. TaxID=2709694 RepID=UPI002AA8778C|nr:recombinase family protein [uncultured Parasphingorhabdus sp.]
MNKAYSYIRMSTKEQLKGDSAARQYRDTVKYAEDNNLEIQDIINDIGVSAFRSANAKNGKLSLFLTAIEEGKIDTGSFLILESLDRLSRADALQAFDLLKKIIDGGITVVTLADGQKYSQDSIENFPQVLFLALGSMMRAHDESKVKSKRMRSAWEGKRKAIQSGKVTKQRIPGWLSYSSDLTKIQPISDRVELLQEIFSLSSNGWGAYSIATKLNERQEKPWGSGRIWHESYIKKLLSNRSVLGEFQPMRFAVVKDKRIKVPDGDEVPNYYPRVISDELFRASKLAIANRKISGSGRKGTENRNIFSGLLRCRCGAGMRYINKGEGPKGGQYIQCSVSLMKGKCKAPSWRYSDLEPAIIEAIKSIDFEAILNDTSSVTKTGNLKSINAELDRQIESVNKQINNFVSAIGMGNAPLPNLVKKLTESEKQQAELEQAKKLNEAELNQLEKFQDQRFADARDELIEKLKRDQSSSENVMLRKKLAAEMRLLIDHITITPTSHEPIELMNGNPEWFASFNRSYRNFEKLCHRFSFEINLRYHNGSIHKFDPLIWQFLPFESSAEFELSKKQWGLPKS